MEKQAEEWTKMSREIVGKTGLNRFDDTEGEFGVLVVARPNRDLGLR